jgi:hypothetical protein
MVEQEISNYNKNQINNIENEIIESFLIHSKESSNDYKLANKHFHKYIKLMCIVLENGHEVLYRFIKHNEPAVRLKGAYFLLPIDKKIAEKTLKSLYKILEDSIGFNAKMIMKEWKNKRLTFPKFKDGKLIWEKKYVNTQTSHNRPVYATPPIRRLGLRFC